MPYKDAERAKNYQREYRRMSRAGDCTTPSTSRLPTEFRLRTAQDVVELLAEQVDAVRNDDKAGTLEKARCVAYLAGIALKAIEAGDVAARVKAIESVLKQRKSSRNGHQ